MDEKEWVRQAQQDASAFGRIYDHYIDRIFRYVYRDVQDEAVAQDITATTFEKALQGIARFQWRDAPFSAWLYAIARNEIHKQRRRQKWLVPLRWFTNKRSAFDVEHVISLSEQQRQLYVMLDRLSPRDRDVIVLRKLEGFSAEEVATILNCPKDDVYVRLSRAMKRLRQQLQTDATLMEVKLNVSP